MALSRLRARRRMITAELLATYEVPVRLASKSTNHSTRAEVVKLPCNGIAVEVPIESL
jgi:hypothetical protein